MPYSAQGAQPDHKAALQLQAATRDCATMQSTWCTCTWLKGHADTLLHSCVNLPCWHAAHRSASSASWAEPALRWAEGPHRLPSPYMKPEVQGPQGHGALWAVGP